jgi:hypothetical protein
MTGGPLKAPRSPGINDKNNLYIYITFERRNFNVYLGIFVIVSDPTEIGIV